MVPTRFAMIVAIFAFTIAALVPTQRAAHHAVTISESNSKRWKILPGSRTQNVQMTIRSDDLPGGTLTLTFVWSWANRGFSIANWPFQIAMERGEGGYAEGSGSGQAAVPNAQNLDIGLDHLNILVHYERQTGRLHTVELGEGDDDGIDIINTQNGSSDLIEPGITVMH